MNKFKMLFLLLVVALIAIPIRAEKIANGEQLIAAMARLNVDQA